MKIMINSNKALGAGITFLFFFVFGVIYIIQGKIPELLVFLALAALFGWVFYRNAITVKISREKVAQTFFGIPLKTWTWDEIAEMGLIGENVFSKKKKSGTKYIYFSKESMTRDERFQMIVKWPPKDKIYFAYTPKALEYAQAIWGKELKTYNVKDLFRDHD